MPNQQTLQAHAARTAQQPDLGKHPINDLAHLLAAGVGPSVDDRVTMATVIQKVVPMLGLECLGSGNKGIFVRGFNKLDLQ
jgi:hypothetical protein